MAQLIDKDKLEEFLNELRENLDDSDFDKGYLCAIDSIFGCYLNSIEVKEVDFDTLGTLASHLIACDAHGISPKYSEKELDLLDKIKNDKEEKGKEVMKNE